MVRLYAPSRPFRLGTRRRRPAGREAGSQTAAASQAGAARRRQAPSSLDTDRQLATSDSITDAEWLNSTLTEVDLYGRSLAFHRELTATYKQIYDRYRAAVDADVKAGVKDPEYLAWWDHYMRESRPRADETPAERHRRIEAWLKANKPTGNNAQAIKWEKKWARLQHCQMEWVGYKADCCGEQTRPLAVPIGCNDRLCPLCAWHRSQRARVKVRQMYDRLHHPVLITLTIPSIKSIRKKYIHHFRKMVREWLGQNRFAPEKGFHGRITGGIYSIECTYNRKQKTWHLHAHILADMTSALPTTADAKVDFFGEQTYAFTKLKWEWEFDWVNLSKDRWANIPATKQPAKKGKAKWALAWAHYREAFRQWTLAKREHSTNWAKAWHPILRKRVVKPDLTAAQQRRYLELEKWNAENTRVFHVEPVSDRDKAVLEVLKYLTKGALFSDIPEAVEEFSAAVESARMVQTFGSWYGFNPDTNFDPEHLDDWGEKNCSCGKNAWSRMPGTFFRRDVVMEPDGRWFLKRPLDHNCAGTVPRATIRALERGEKEGGEQWAR